MYQPDVVQRLCLMDHGAASWTSVAAEEVLHDAALTNWDQNKKTVKKMYYLFFRVCVD